MRSPKRLLGAVLLAVASGYVTLAIAQPRAAKPPAARPGRVQAAPKPVDAGAPDEPATGASVDGAKAATPAPAEPPAEGVADGGPRPSPLNPQPQELPSGSAEAGAPVDYDRLLADVAALRARVAAVTANLYQSRIAVAIQAEGDHGKIARLVVSLDDGVVYTAPPTFAAQDMTTVYDHAVAPGRHALTVDVERKDDRDEAFRSAQRSRFTVDVPRDSRLDVQVRVVDESTMGADFPSDRSGKYDLRLRVKTVASPVGRGR